MWKQLTLADFSQFKLARLQLHQACQLLANVAEFFVPRRKDYSHSSFIWSNEVNGVRTEELNQDRYCIALSFPSLEISLFQDDKTIDSFPLNSLDHKTTEKKVLELLTKYQFNINSFEFKPLFEIPETPQAKGEPYLLDNQAVFTELEHYYSNANLLLSRISEEYGSSEVRCWPHHFDIATLLNLDKNKSIGLGFSPGDSSYHEPYFYVSPWPYPNLNSIHLPQLSHHAFWHTEKWVGAIFTASTIIENKNEKKTIVNSFLTSALYACKQLLDDK